MTNEKTPLTGGTATKPSDAIPHRLRVMTNTSCALGCLLFSGIIFGWAPLELMLLREGVYAEAGPSEQIVKLNGIFTVAQFALNFVSLPTGILLDTIPTSVYYTITAFIEICGLLLFAFDHFMVGYSLMALGGSMSMLGAFPATFLLPHVQAGLLAGVSCLFDASSIVFFGFNTLDKIFPIVCNRRNMFIAWSVLAVALYATIIGCFYKLEQLDWKQLMDDDKDHIAREATVQAAQEVAAADAKNGEKGGTEKKKPSGGHHYTHRLHGLPLMAQAKTYEFALAMIYVSAHMVRANFYIMIVDHFLLYLGDDTSLYANIFSLVLPFGVIFVPVIEATVTKLGVVQTLHVTNALGVIFGALLLVKNLPVQVVAMVVFTCFRAFLYATLNNFVAVFFGIETMGRIIGFALTFSAFCTLVQYPLGLWATSGEGHYMETMETMLALCLVPIVMTCGYKVPETAGEEEEEDEEAALIESATKGMTEPFMLSPRMSVRYRDSIRNSLRSSGVIVGDFRRSG